MTRENAFQYLERLSVEEELLIEDVLHGVVEENPTELVQRRRKKFPRERVTKARRLMAFFKEEVNLQLPVKEDPCKWRGAYEYWANIVKHYEGRKSRK